MGKSKNYIKMAQASMLVALTILLAFTPIGYLKIGLIEITFMTVPVIIAAVLLGPTYSTLIGAIFGASSFIQCFGMSIFGSTLFAINPVFTFIICVVPRVLMGYLAGLFYQIFSKSDKTKNFSHIIASVSAPVLNTLFFMTALVLLFGNSEYIQEMMAFFNTENFFIFAVLFVGTNGLIEAIICTILGFTLVKVLVKILKK